jgi:aspartyl protease family protein
MRIAKRYTIWFCLLILSQLAGCSGCSRSGSHQPRRPKRKPTSDSVTTQATTKPTLKQIGDGPTEVAMEKRNGVYLVPVTINGQAMQFILDTGASLISMSTKEAEALFREGTITNRDIIGQSQFQDANGDISPGAIVRLRSVRIGDRVLENVNANVVGNAKAPLLLGQSALSKFGRISLDYRRNVVTFD